MKFEIKEFADESERKAFYAKLEALAASGVFSGEVTVRVVFGAVANAPAAKKP